jgi:hypothetical protein
VEAWRAVEQLANAGLAAVARSDDLLLVDPFQQG